MRIFMIVNLLILKIFKSIVNKKLELGIILSDSLRIFYVRLLDVGSSESEVKNQYQKEPEGQNEKCGKKWVVNS